VQCDMVWCGVVWCGVVWCGVVCIVIWCGTECEWELRVCIVIWYRTVPVPSVNISSRSSVSLFLGNDCNSVSAREVSILTDRRRFGDTRRGYPLPLHIFQTVLQPAPSPAAGCRTEECIAVSGNSRAHLFPSKLPDQ
jgi:hypothetical protein